MSDFDFDESCTADSSATLKSNTSVRACAESVLGDLPDGDLMVNFVVTSIECAGTGGAEVVLSLIGNLSEYGAESWRTAIAMTVTVDTPQVVGECLRDLAATFFE